MLRSRAAAVPCRSVRNFKRLRVAWGWRRLARTWRRQPWGSGVGTLNNGQPTTANLVPVPTPKHRLSPEKRFKGRNEGVPRPRDRMLDGDGHPSRELRVRLLPRRHWSHTQRHCLGKHAVVREVLPRPPDLQCPDLAFWQQHDRRPFPRGFDQSRLRRIRGNGACIHSSLSRMIRSPSLSTALTRRVGAASSAPLHTPGSLMNWVRSMSFSSNLE